MTNQNNYALSKNSGRGFGLVNQPGLPPVKPRTSTKPKMEMFGGVVPYNTYVPYDFMQTEQFGSFHLDLDARLSFAVSVCGVHPVYWYDLWSALQHGLKPFDSWFKKPAALTWVEIGQRIIPFVGEVFLPPLRPTFLKRLGCSQDMYVAYLSEFWGSLDDLYFIPWDMQGELGALADSAYPGRGSGTFLSAAIKQYEENLMDELMEEIDGG